MSTYFDGPNLTDAAILTEDLMRRCTFSLTPPRPVPDTLNMKDKDKYDYFTRNLQVTYPDSSPSASMIIPDVVLHCDTFDHFGKTGVYVGVPQAWVDFIRTKILSKGVKPLFEEPGVASTAEYWWCRQGFVTASSENEYIFVVDEEGGDIVEDAYPSFADLFSAIGDSVVANVTCSIKMSSKLPKGSKHSWTGDEDWKMGITVTRVNVIDFITVDKPRNAIASKSIAGTKDKAKSRLMDRLRKQKS
jgi:hypothetical protein